MSKKEIVFFSFLLNGLYDLYRSMRKKEAEHPEGVSFAYIIGNSLVHLPPDKKAEMAALWREFHGPVEAGMGEIMTRYTAMIVEQYALLERMAGSGSSS